MPANWRDIVAEVTLFYRWGPHEAFSLTWTQISWWNAQAHRMIGVGSG